MTKRSLRIVTSSSCTASLDRRIKFSRVLVIRERALLISRRILASSGLARSSNSPVGRIFFFNSEANFVRSFGKADTVSNSVGHFSRSARIAVRASIARSQSRARSRIANGSRAVPSILSRDSDSLGSAMPSKDNRAPRCRSSIISPAACSARAQSFNFSIGSSVSMRTEPISVCAIRRTSMRNESNSKVAKA